MAKFEPGNKTAFAKGNNTGHESNLALMDRFQALLSADPEGAKKLLAGLVSKKFTPHPGQQPVMDSHARFKLMCAGRRFGKTKIAAALGHRKARREKQIIWWVAPTYKIVKRGYAEVIRQLPANVLSKPAPAEASFDSGRSVVLQFKNGSKWEFYSAERPEGMLGEGVDLVILDEAAIMAEHIWTQIVRPTLADRGGESLLISTPRGRNWFYKMYLRGQDEQYDDYASWRFPSMANPYIPAEEWDEMRDTLPAAIYEQEILADFVSNAAAVFRIPDEAIKELHRPEGHVTLGIDLAKHNDFTVICGVRDGDRMPCYHERFNAISWPEQRRRIHSVIEQLEADDCTVSIMLDTTGIGDVVYDDLTLEGLDVVPIKFTPQWKQMAVMLLAADLERGNAFLHDEQLREFESYAYEITEAGRWKFEAASGHDDEVSAMLLAHWGIVNEGVPDIKLLTSSGVGDDGYDIEGTVAEEMIDADETLVDDGHAQITEHAVSLPDRRELLVKGWW